MITGWGAHHIDIAHWGMGVEHSGPIEISAQAEFPKKGLWDVHGPFHVEARYANGATMIISDTLPVGIKFIGEDGWIWVTRGTYPVPAAVAKSGKLENQALAASDPRILDSKIESGEIHLHVSPKGDHHLDWLTSIRTRNEPAAPAEIGHRSCTGCLLAHAAMKLGRKLTWDPEHERFVNDDEANRLLSRPQRVALWHGSGQGGLRDP